MRHLEKIIFTLFPEWQLNGSPWKPLWNTKKRAQVKTITRFVYALLIVAYPIHYFFVDESLGLTGDSRWFYYRFGLTLVSTIGLLLSFSWIQNSYRFTSGYFLLNGLMICYFQAQSVTWYSGVPYFWGIAFAIIVPILSLLQFFWGLCYSAILLVIQYPALKLAGVSTSLIMGAYVAAIFIVMVFKFNQQNLVRSFIGDQERIELQSKIIESQKSMNEQIQAFLPRKIRDRLTQYILKHRQSIVQAIEQVLSPRTAHIVALFSDIRGYTQASKKRDYLEESAIPNMKVLTEAIEKNEGIPRLIGDLLFAYFDEENYLNNIKQGFRAAAEILEINDQFNYSQPEELKITRYVLLDGGQAVVGNIGGATSAREITAMGTCVNRLSRMDLLTKSEVITGKIGKSAILMSKEIGAVLERLYPALVFQQIALDELGLFIKDFPEEKQIYYFRISDQGFSLSFRSQDSRGVA